jgi:type IV pilus assembly protein PilV
MNMPMQSQGGVSLIEVLVAIFLTMVGLMGVMGVQVFSQRQATTSGQRSVVVQSTEMIMERMRGNILGVQCGHYMGVAIAVPICGAGGAAQVRAQADLLEWQQAIAPKINDATLTAVGVAQSGGILMSVRWTEKDAVTPDPACPNGSALTLRCFNTPFLP